MRTLIRLKFLLFRTIFESRAGPPSVLPSPAAKSTTAALNFGPCFLGRGWKRAVCRPVGRPSERSEGRAGGGAKTREQLVEERNEMKGMRWMDVRNDGRRWGRSKESAKGGTEKLEIETDDRWWKTEEKNAAIWFLPGSQVWNLTRPFHKASVWMFSASLNQSGSVSRKHCQLSLKTTEKPKDEEGEETTRPLTTVSDEQICVDNTTKIKGQRWQLFLFHPQVILPRLHDCLGHRSEGMSFQVCGYNSQQLRPKTPTSPNAQRFHTTEASSDLPGVAGRSCLQIN